MVGFEGWRGLWKTATIDFGGGVAIGVSTLRGCWVRSAAPAVPAVQCALRDGARVALQEVDEAFGRRCAVQMEKRGRMSGKAQVRVAIDVGMERHWVGIAGDDGTVAKNDAGK